MVQVSNAFAQGRRKFLSSKLPIGKLFAKAKSEHITPKHLSMIAQAAANINKNHPRIRAYWNSVAKIARYLGHKAKKDYSLNYPENKKYEAEARPVLKQLKTAAA